MPRRPESDLSDFGDDRGDLLSLGRLALWAGLTALAAFGAVLAARSDLGAQRMAAALNGSFGPARSVAAARPENGQGETSAETRRLSMAVAVLAADRDRLLARLEALERSIDVTGAVPRPAENGGEKTAASGSVSEPSAGDNTVTRTEFGLDLGSEPSLEALRALWITLKAQHGRALEGLRPVVAIRDDAKSGGTELRLVAGPLLNAASAARLCAVVGATGRQCRPVAFEGQRLALR
jgi:hypothetical protein